MDPGVPAADDAGHGLLVGIVGDGPQQTHGHRLDALGHQPIRHLLDLPVIGVDQHRSLVVDASLHLFGQASRRQRLGLLQGRYV